MHDRTVLGPADVSDAELAAIVAGSLGRRPEEVELIESAAEVVAYDLDAITTAGRYWVSGRVRAGREVTPFRFFVKHVQSWSRSPWFEQVPTEHRAMAEATVPWRTEPLVYRSDLADRLPAGLAMTPAVAVRDLDEKSAAVWLTEVHTQPRDWSVAQLADAAYLLGRLAASPSARELADIGEADLHRSTRTYVEGRLAVQILPMLRSDELFRHPLLAASFRPELVARLRAAADRVPGYLAEVEAVPFGTAHGDACTNNLLVPAGSDDLVLIDFGFWSTQPIGFDLSQLLLGDVQLGRRPAAGLAEIDAAITSAYVEGLRAEGCELDASVVARCHALLMLLYSGLSAFPWEHLGQPPSPELLAVARGRAVVAEYLLDQVDATTPIAARAPGIA